MRGIDAGDDYIDPDPDGLVPAEIKATLDKDQVRGMRNVFDAFDGDSDGIVEPGNIGALLRTLGLITSRKMLRCIVEVIDVNGDGEIDFGEFVTLLCKVKRMTTPEPEEQPAKQRTAAEKEAAALRLKALNSFKQAVTIMAFKQMTGDADSMRDQVLKVLDTEPSKRTEWELQRLLMWVETAELDFILQLPPVTESDVRVEVCRCLSVTRFVPGQEIIRIGERGDCMYIVLHGEVDVVEDREGPGGTIDRVNIASMGVGKCVGELAIVGDESERERTATVVAGGKQQSILGVLTRTDYKRFILKMRVEEMQPVVDMLAENPILDSNADLLQMALTLHPVKFVRHEVIVEEGVVPEVVTFLTSGAADMTVSRCSSAKRRKGVRGAGRGDLPLCQLNIGSAVEMVGDHIVLDGEEPSPFTLIATTATEGWQLRKNLAKRFLGAKKENRERLKDHRQQVLDFVAGRKTQVDAAGEAAQQLGFGDAANRPARSARSHRTKGSANRTREDAVAGKGREWNLHAVRSSRQMMPRKASRPIRLADGSQRWRSTALSFTVTSADDMTPILAAEAERWPLGDQIADPLQAIPRRANQASPPAKSAEHQKAVNAYNFPPSSPGRRSRAVNLAGLRLSARATTPPGSRPCALFPPEGGPGGGVVTAAMTARGRLESTCALPPLVEPRRPRPPTLHKPSGTTLPNGGGPSNAPARASRVLGKHPHAVILEEKTAARPLHRGPRPLHRGAAAAMPRTPEQRTSHSLLSPKDLTREASEISS